MLDTENIRRLYEANERIDPNSSSVKTSNADKISSIIISQMNLVIYLRRVIPNDIVSSNDSIAKLVAEVAKQFIYFAESVNTRYGTYNMCMTDNSITSYRNFLAEIKQGLPDELMQETKLEDISKPISQETSNSTSASNDGCYVATAVYGSYDCPQVWTLRRFRDNTLYATWYGRTFIKTYYATSPTLVKWFGNTEWFKNMCRKPLDKLVSKLRREVVEDTPYQDKRY